MIVIARPQATRSLLLALSGFLLLALDNLFHDLGFLHQECTEDAEVEGWDDRGDLEDTGTYRDLTQSPQRDPPYARRTVFMRFETVAYWRGRRAGTCSIEHTP